MNNDKPLLRSKKAVLAILGLIAVTLIAMTGNGDPTVYGAITVIIGGAIGVQGAADYKGASR